MTTITVPACKILQGDLITITARVTAILADVPRNAPRSTVIFLEADRFSGAIYVEPDMVAKVERPDPDAELIEAMANALARREEWDGLDDPHMHPAGPEAYRADARAALAAYRSVVA